MFKLYKEETLAKKKLPKIKSGIIEKITQDMKN